MSFFGQFALGCSSKSVNDIFQIASFFLASHGVLTTKTVNKAHNQGDAKKPSEDQIEKIKTVSPR
jgi:hypothetical protein